MHDIHAGLVDEAVGEITLRRVHAVAPVPAPVHGRHRDVVFAPGLCNRLRHGVQRRRREVPQEIHPGAIGKRRPARGHPGAVHAPCEHEHPVAGGQIDERRRRGRRGVLTGARRAQPRRVQAIQGLLQAGMPPVQHVIVGEHAAFDARRGETGHVGRVHAVVDALARPGLLAGGDGGLQIDDARRRLRPRDLLQRVAPDVGVVHRPCDGAVGALGDLHVAERGAHVGFVEVRLARVREDLIDAAAGHHVAAQEQRHGVHGRPASNASP